MKLFNLSLQLNGFPLKKALQSLEKIHKLSESDYLNYLEFKKKEIVTYHLNHTPFYSTHCKSQLQTDWSNLPVMTKKDLQQPLRNRLSTGFNERNVYINKTSGSSGDPFIFAKDKFCHALTWAEIQNRFNWYDIDFNTSLQARFYGIPLDTKGHFKERFKDKLSKRYRFNVFDLSEQAYESYLTIFKEKPFDYINGYTSSIVQFAKFLKLKSINLKELCPSLKCCIVTSEMLFTDDKTLLETYFGIPVINEYGASELDVIAFQNPDSLWRVNSDTLFVEILDDQDRILPYGKEGRIVITSLYNKAHPFIRYDIGDTGSLSEDSTLQTPVLKHLTGRTNDIAILPSGKKSPGLTFYYVTKAIIEDDGNVKEFVITQEDKNKFKIDYVAQSEISEVKKQTIKTEIKRYLEDGLEIAFERHQALQRSKSGKLKQFKSLLTY